MQTYNDNQEKAFSNIRLRVLFAEIALIEASIQILVMITKLILTSFFFLNRLFFHVESEFLMYTSIKVSAVKIKICDGCKNTKLEK